jgi:anaerobic ribonucleoside-triphosphate reductase activating protein
VRKELPQKSIWIYTGFVYDVDLIRGGKRYGPNTDMLLNSIDVLVDGRFEQSRKNIALPFRGSENQRIIDMRRSHQEGHIITIEM